MMKDFILPDIGEGIVECELLEWLVSEGDIIVEDQAVAEVMTDKATVQIPAMYSGKVTKLYYQTGEIAQVHQPLFAMDIENAAPLNDDSSPAENQQSTLTITNPVNSKDQIEDFILPDIGEGIVECELVKWLVSEGDEIVEDQAVVEVMTDKALVEIPAKYSGVVTKLYYQQGETAKVHTPLFAMQLSSDLSSARETGPSVKPADTPEVNRNSSRLVSVGHTAKALASPAVRRVARELNIDISMVAGSGKKGRVLKHDLHEFKAGSGANDINNSNLAVVTEKSAPTVAGGVRKEPIKGMRAAMAKQMSLSVSSIPHFTVSEEIEMDKLIEVRQSLKAGFDKEQIKLSFMPFFIKALSMALKQFPVINSQVNDDCSEISYFDDHNIGLAVDAKMGLMVPNIKGVQHLSIKEIALELNRLVEDARAGRLASFDLKGGTISISNIGVLGGTVATPVINHPEVAIVALGKTQRLPRFDANDQVKAVNIMQVSWSGDHRVIDGATMVRFNNLWKSYLENPLLMLADLH